MNPRSNPPFVSTQAPSSARRVETVSSPAERPATSTPRGKICLSIDVDSSLGHIMHESYGDRLLVDKEQARRLAAVLMDYAGEPPASPPQAVAESALLMVSEQLSTLLNGQHCNDICHEDAQPKLV